MQAQYKPNYAEHIISQNMCKLKNKAKCSWLLLVYGLEADKQRQSLKKKKCNSLIIFRLNFLWTFVFDRSEQEYNTTQEQKQDAT